VEAGVIAVWKSDRHGGDTKTSKSLDAKYRQLESTQRETRRSWPVALDEVTRQHMEAILRSYECPECPRYSAGQG
jgi:hypothetical protein